MSRSAAVITVSDRSARGERPDAAGPVAVEALRAAGWDCADAAVVADGAASVAGALRAAIAGGARLIVTTGGRPLSQDSAEGMFSEIRWTLLGRGETFSGRMPRLHDARHSFTVATILRWHEEGEDVNALIPYLSAYLGHKKLSDTYWYLTGVPELLAVAAESFWRMGLGAGNGQN